MRRAVAGTVGLLLIFSLTTGAWAGDPGENRIVIDSAKAEAMGLSIRHRLGSGRVSATVSDAELVTLGRSGTVYVMVPIRTISGGKVDRSKQPPTQVPYGVRMVYGNPKLTAAQISGGNRITVAVVDTGSISHRDFQRTDGSSIIVGCVDFSRKKADLIEGQCKDGNGHGTHVTGTIAATGGEDGTGIYGVAPGVNILSYKVLADNGTGYADDIARGIRVAADRGAKIINLSLGAYSPSPEEQDAIDYAVSKGVLVIAAAGNAGPQADTIAYPAGSAKVVAVAALNANESVAYYSSRGITDGHDRTIAEREIEVAAPGTDVVSTYKSGGYAMLSGTSMAAPHISGLAAKMWQGTAEGTRAWLRQAASRHDVTRAEDLPNAGVGYDIASGYGLPQVKAVSQTLWQD